MIRAKKAVIKARPQKRSIIMHKIILFYRAFQSHTTLKCHIAIRLPKCEDISTGSHSERFSNFYADSAKGLNSDFDPHFSQDSRLQCEECKMEKQERILGDQTKAQREEDHKKRNRN